MALGSWLSVIGRQRRSHQFSVFSFQFSVTKEHCGRKMSATPIRVTDGFDQERVLYQKLSVGAFLVKTDD